MKKFFALLCMIAIFCSFSTAAFADVIVEEPITNIAQEGTVEPQAEETGWFFRENNGYLEKRLWSYTYGVWLTDWEVVGPIVSG